MSSRVRVHWMAMVAACVVLGTVGVAQAWALSGRATVSPVGLIASTTVHGATAQSGGVAAFTWQANQPGHHELYEELLGIDGSRNEQVLPVNVTAAPINPPATPQTLSGPPGAQRAAHPTGFPGTVVQTLAPATAPRSRLTGPQSKGQRVSLKAAKRTAWQGWSINDRGAGRVTRIINQRTGLCLDFRRDSSAAGAGIVTDVCRTRSVSEQWLQVRVTGGDWRLVNQRTHQELFAHPTRRTAIQRGKHHADAADWKEQPAASSSYTLRSSTVSVPVSPFKRPKFHGLCAHGYHVTGTYTRLSSGTWLFDPSFHVHGKHIYSPDSGAADPTGTTDEFGRPFYRGLKVTLGNHSLISSHDGYFTWTCAPS